jgi:hypothetical protein
LKITVVVHFECLNQFLDNYLRGKSIKLYHGSTVVADAPRILKIEIGWDFGSGFYNTGINEQAGRWVKQKALINRTAGKLLEHFHCVHPNYEKLYFA